MQEKGINFEVAITVSTTVCKETFDELSAKLMDLAVKDVVTLKINSIMLEAMNISFCKSFFQIVFYTDFRLYIILIKILS